ncbi:MAG: hypothetical protein ACSHX3_15375 [Litorimonas sp.]
MSAFRRFFGHPPLAVDWEPTARTPASLRCAVVTPPFTFFITHPALGTNELVLERFTSALTLRGFCDARRRLRPEFSRASPRFPTWSRWAVRLTH